VKNCKECKNYVADKELYIGKCKATGRTTMMNDTCGCYEGEQERREMINPAVDDIDGWYE
jgi:hypothetical protein